MDFEELLNSSLAYIGKKLEEHREDVIDGLENVEKAIEKSQDPNKDKRTKKIVDAIDASSEIVTEVVGEVGQRLEEFTGALDDGLDRVSQTQLESVTDIIIGLEELKNALLEDERGEVGLREVQGILKDVLAKTEALDETNKEHIQRTGETNKTLEQVLEAVKGIKLEEKDIDLSGIDTLANKVDTLVKTVKDKDTKKIEKQLDELKKVCAGIEIKVPDTIKIDEDQFRELRTLLSSTGGVVVGGSGPSTLVNEAGDIINPATEETAQAVLAALGGGAYATKIAENSVNSNIIYFGKAAVGSLGSSAVWQVSRMDTSSILADTEWADGDDNFDNQWSNRESLSYS